jgi:hypothetical protein
MKNEKVGRTDPAALAEIGRGRDFGGGKIGGEGLHRLAGAQFIRSSMNSSRGLPPATNS